MIRPNPRLKISPFRYKKRFWKVLVGADDWSGARL